MHAVTSNARPAGIRAACDDPAHAMILLVRHGQTFWNREGRIQGRTDSELTPLGERQAAAMASLMAELIAREPNPFRLVSSPIGRARQTAEIIARATRLPVELDERLAEICCGEWEGLLHHEVSERHPEHYAREWVYGAPGGETFDDVMARVRAWLADQAAEPERRIIVVSHGVWGRCLRGAYADLARNDVDRQPTHQDAIFRLRDGKIDRFDCGSVE
jgi:probable phosphoglycerate mutase